MSAKAGLNFTRAIVRPPSASFADGLSTSKEGAPDLRLALHQHARYVQTLVACGLEVTRLEPEQAYPDSTFVEDAAIVTAAGAIVTRPGAPSRQGETQSMTTSLQRFYATLEFIEAPGTVDGGDICEADGHFLIGLSARTNESGAQQLARHLSRFGYSSSVLDIRANPTLLHLKSGIAYLGEGLWAADASIEAELRRRQGITVRDLVVTGAAEAYAANCVRINASILVAAGYPVITDALQARGARVELLDVSEFRKMDGGLSCLSLRF